jgi:uncharacterized membrane protein YtjA (UPF0391 family)
VSAVHGVCHDDLVSPARVTSSTVCPSRLRAASALRCTPVRMGVACGATFSLIGSFAVARCGGAAVAGRGIGLHCRDGTGSALKPTYRAKRVTKDPAMLYWAAVFFVIALLAAVFGFGGIAASAVGVAKVLFFVFLILAVVSLIFGRRVPT